MMKYALVQQNTVREVFATKPTFHPDLMAQIVEAPDSVKPHQHFDGKNFGEAPKAPPPSALERIHLMEREITPRRLRDAVLGRDKGWLAAKEAEIAELRKKL